MYAIDNDLCLKLLQQYAHWKWFHEKIVINDNIDNDSVS